MAITAEMALMLTHITEAVRMIIRMTIIRHGGMLTHIQDNMEQGILTIIAKATATASTHRNVGIDLGANMFKHGDKKEPTSVTFFSTDELLQELATRHDCIVFCGIRFETMDKYTVKVKHTGHSFARLAAMEIIRDQVVREERERLRDAEGG